MASTTFASIVIAFYGAVCLVGIAFWLMFLHVTKRYNLLIATAVVGAIGSIFLVPKVYDGLIISGIPKYWISFSTGVSTAFVPMIIASIVVLKIMTAIKKNHIIPKHWQQDEDITRFYGNSKNKKW